MRSLDRLTVLISGDSDGPLKDLTLQLLTLAIDGSTSTRQVKPIESLRFEMISERPARVVEAYPSTFDWLFTDMKPGGVPGFLCAGLIESA